MTCDCYVIPMDSTTGRRGPTRGRPAPREPGEGTRLSLGELAGAAGVSVRTVRYYVAEGLLPPPAATGPGRHYRAAHLNRLRLIGRLKAAYLPLREIRRRLAGLDDAAVAALLGGDAGLPGGNVGVRTGNAGLPGGDRGLPGGDADALGGAGPVPADGIDAPRFAGPNDPAVVADTSMAPRLDAAFPPPSGPPPAGTPLDRDDVPEESPMDTAAAYLARVRGGQPASSVAPPTGATPPRHRAVRASGPHGIPSDPGRDPGRDPAHRTDAVPASVARFRLAEAPPTGSYGVLGAAGDLAPGAPGGQPSPLGVGAAVPLAGQEPPTPPGETALAEAIPGVAAETWLRLPLGDGAELLVRGDAYARLRDRVDWLVAWARRVFA